MKVCVAGDSGLLGQAIVKFAAAGNHYVLGVSTSEFPENFSKKKPFNFVHEKMDLSAKPNRFRERLRTFRPDLLINAVALVDLVGCEEKPGLAHLLNAEVASWLAGLAAAEGAAFIHISTDHVFDGKKEGPYNEVDTPAPINIYGATKLEGERAVLYANPLALVARTNIVGFRGKAGKPTFAEWISRALFQKERINLADDFVTSPMHVTFFSRLLFLAHRCKLMGVHHIASQDSISKYRFGELLAEQIGADFSAVSRVKLRDLGLMPPRPANLALDVGRAEKMMGEAFPSVRQTVEYLGKELSEELDIHDKNSVRS